MGIEIKNLRRVGPQLVLALVMGAGMWLYFQLVLIPYQRSEDPIGHSLRGNLSDLYPRWLGARELLLHKRDPYAADITLESQSGYYGRRLDRSRAGDPIDQQGFAYPIYVVLLLAPTVTLPFATVNEACFWLFAACTAAAVPLWLRTLGWQRSKSALLVWIVLTLSCFPAIQALKLRQLLLVVAFTLAGAMSAVVRGRLAVGGVLLALATIKPQLVFLLVAWLCIWVVGNWRERQRLLWSFAASMAVLISAGEFLLPGWVGEFRNAMRDYYQYTGGATSLLDILLSPTWGWIISVLSVAVVLVVAWRYRRMGQETLGFQWTICFAIVTTLLVIPRFAPYNELLLLPAVMMAVRSGRELWTKSRFSRFFCSIAALSIAWPFFSAMCLVIGLAFLPAPTVQKAWGLPLYPSFAIPITIYALLLVSRKVIVDDAPAGLMKQPVSAHPAGINRGQSKTTS